MDVFRAIAGAKRRTFLSAAGQLRHSAGPRNERADFLGVVTDLNSVVINDDGPAENRGVLPNEFNQLRDGHVVEIDIVFRNDFAAGRNDVIGAVFRFRDDFHQVFARKPFAENILLFVRDILVIEPLLYLPATGAARRIIDFDHMGVL